MRAFFIACIVTIVCFVCAGDSCAQWDKYPTYQQYLDIMAKFQADYPQLCKVEEFGTSVNNRKLLAVKISDNVDIHEKEPAFLYMSSIHGDELTGYMLLLRLADYLLSNYKKDTLVTKLVDNIEIWLNPLANPDGTFKGSDTSVMGAMRYNANNKDLDRNFPLLPETGTSQNPEKETKAIMDFMTKYRFAMSACFHGGIEAILYPWCSKAKSHPDSGWFDYVGNVYIDLAKMNAPSGYFKPMASHPDACVECSYFYGGTITPRLGGLIDYAVYYQHVRNITIEVSTTKLMPEAQLGNYWSYNKDALLAFIQQALFGITGIVTDELTGQPLCAKVLINNHDKDSSWIFSHVPHGDYYRPIIKGTYSITFSANGYISKTISDVAVENNTATVLDLKLKPMLVGIDKHAENGVPEIIVTQYNGLIKISCDNLNRNTHIAIYDIQGRLIKNIRTEADIGKRTVFWEGVDNRGVAVSCGCYLACCRTGEGETAQRFIFSR